MDPNSRRDFLQGATALALGTWAGADASAAANSQGDSVMINNPPAFTFEQQPKPLSFDPAKLDGLSEKLMRSHWENNYGGSVKALHAVQQRLSLALQDKELPPYLYNDLKREHLLRTGSVVLHELYFDSLGSGAAPSAEIRKTVAASFGDFETWAAEFRRIGAGLGGGSGWVVLGWNLHTKRLENYWLWDHMHGAPATLPILVMDMYEHSYQMDYGAAAAKYIDAFFRNIRWDKIGARLEAARRAADAIRT